MKTGVEARLDGSSTVMRHQPTPKIEWLPVEILHVIFLVTLDDVYESSPPRLCPMLLEEARGSLTLVCRWWAEICNSCSNLWTYITFSHHDVSRRQTRIGWVQKCISRSAGRQLTLVLSSPSTVRPYYFPTPCCSELEVRLNSFVDVLVANATADRISRLSLGVFPRGNTHQILSQLSSLGTRLDEARLDTMGCFGDLDFSSPDDDPYIQFESLASTQRLHVAAAKLYAPALIRMFSGHIAAMVQSITLECKMCYGADPHMYFRTDDTSSAWNISYQPLLFPRLRSLQLIQCDLSPYLFDAPHLVHLVWIPHHIVGALTRGAFNGPYFVVRARNVHNYHFPMLSSLVVSSLNNTSAFIEDVSALIRAHPQISDLRIVGQTGASSLLRCSYEVNSLSLGPPLLPPSPRHSQHDLHMSNPPRFPPHLPFYAPRQLHPIVVPPSLQTIIIETTSTSIQFVRHEAWEDELMNVLYEVLKSSKLSMTWIRGPRQRAYTSDDLRVLDQTWSPVTVPTSSSELGRISLQDMFPGRFTHAMRREYVHWGPRH